jgi:hypothetical protein
MLQENEDIQLEEAAKLCLKEVEKSVTLCNDEYEENIFISGFINGANYQKQQDLKDAIGFAEWLTNSQFIYRPYLKVWINITRTKTTSQLYELFKQSKTKA